MRTATALDHIDLTDLDRWVEGVPYDWFELMRSYAPLHWQDERDGKGFWSFTLYDDIVAVSRDVETYSSEAGGTSLQDLSPEEVELRKSMIDTDPAAAHAAAGDRQPGLHAEGRARL